MVNVSLYHHLRKMAEDKNFDITRIQGTGGNNRITKLDIQRVEEQGYDIEAKMRICNLKRIRTLNLTVLMSVKD